MSSVLASTSCRASGPLNDERHWQRPEMLGAPVMAEGRLVSRFFFSCSHMCNNPKEDSIHSINSGVTMYRREAQCLSRDPDRQGTVL